VCDRERERGGEREGGGERKSSWPLREK